MALVSATVNSAKFSGTSHSNFPAYVDLSQMPAAFWSTVKNGGGDIRCYSDEAKTTELAREVVSCDTSTDTGELHVKIPTFTDTSVIYIDVDGTRSDYAVTATYGRNAVWSDYEFVSHDGGGTDSTGNHTMNTNGAVTAGGATGKLGNATDFDGLNDFFYTTVSKTYSELTFSFWFKTSDGVTRMHPGGIDGGGNSAPRIRTGFNIDQNEAVRLWVEDSGRNTDAVYTNTTDYQDDAWHLAQLKWTGGQGGGTSNIKIFLDGAEDTNVTQRNNANVSTTSPTNMEWGRNPGDNDRYYNGLLDEIRIVDIARSSDWITTEYENQNDPANFWTIAEVTEKTRNPIFGFGGM